MCWVVYIASDQPLSADQSTSDNFSFRIDSLDTPTSEPIPEGAKYRSPHSSLPHAYLAHAGAECGFNCGIEHPNLRSKVHNFLQEELSKGNRLELVFSQVDQVYTDLELTIHMTPSALKEVYDDWEVRAQGMDSRNYPMLHAAVPLGDRMFFSVPRRIRFVSESEIANSNFASTRATPPESGKSRLFHDLVSKEVDSGKVALVAYVIFVAVIFLLIKWLM
jgi:hypothetical protein